MVTIRRPPPPPVDAGVPQGSILEPLLFLVHLDDIVINLACAISLYADDACLIEIVDSSPAVSATKINSDLQSLLNWSIQWLMIFNTLKSLALTLTRKRKLLHNPHLTINGVILVEVNQHCHLGLVINKSLPWENHINYMLGKEGKIVNIMRCLKYTLSRKALERLFINRIRPIIEYADVIYDNCPKYLADRLEGVQMEAARICIGGMRQTSSEKLLLELGWEPLFKRRKWHKLIYMFKIVHGLSPLYLFQICQPTASSTRYATRSANKIRVPRCRTSYFKNSLFSSSIRYWNSLDYSIRNLDSLSLFKRRIKDKYGYKRPPPHYYSGLRSASICHTRLRLGMSQLSAHLFPFGFDESPRCSCGVTHETVSHYLLDCRLYAAQRERLLAAIRNIIAPTLHPATLPILDKDAYIKILLFGSKDLSSEENILFSEPHKISF